jgi:hypothetical protein
MSTSSNIYNTNLASEYFVMSLLCRAGIDAYLSLGNKKGVDVLVKTANGSVCIVEVKGVNKRNDWLINNNGKFDATPNMIYALVCYNGQIDDLTATPDFWFIPSNMLAKRTEHKIANNGRTVYVSNKHVRDKYQAYFNNIDCLMKHVIKR